MILAAWLFACTSAPPVTGPDADAGAAAAEALCKLLEGAQQECEARASTVTWGDRTIAVDVVLLSDEEKFGHFSFEGRVTVSEGGVAYMSPAIGYGAARQESFRKAFHEWAVISGVAIVDALIADPKRPALRALDESQAQSEGADKAGPFNVIRGYTLIRGDKPPEEGVSQVALVAAIGILAADLDPAKPHVASLHRASGIGGVDLKCWLDGARSESLCQVLNGYDWPIGMSWEIKQTYVLVP